MCMSGQNLKVVSNLVPRNMTLKPFFHLDIVNISMLLTFYTKHLYNFCVKNKSSKLKISLQHIFGCRFMSSLQTL